MNSLDIIRGKIKRLYDTHPDIHIDVLMTHPKVNLKNEPVTIKEIYPHIFQIEERSTGVPKRYTLQYTDVLTKQITILELEA